MEAVSRPMVFHCVFSLERLTFGTMSRHRSIQFVLPLLLALFLGGCQKQEAKIVSHQMGDRVDIGQLSYVVVESIWRNQLGEGLQAKSPQNRFLILSLSITNRGSSEASLPFLNAESTSGQRYQELKDGVAVSDWLGIIRTISPGQTIQGRIVFDVPLTALKLELPEGGESGYDKYAWVEIPLRLDLDQVQAPLPLPGSDSK